MKIYELVGWGEKLLTDNTIENSAYDAKTLMLYTLKCDMSRYIMLQRDEIDPDREAEYRGYIEKRSTHYPLQYITGEQCFMGYDFYIDENVLIPRQDTEILVEEALKVTKDKTSVKALDMCTGSGCIGISYSLFRKEAGKSSDVTLVDISKGALSVAARNNESLNAGVKLVESDLFNGVQDFDYDIIMSNPPYIESEVIDTLMEEVKCFEPRLALDGTHDGLLFYREISKAAFERLTCGGHILYEIGYNQYEDVKNILQGIGYKNIYLKKDLAGLDRVVVASKE